jgi:hypothetical protein
VKTTDREYAEIADKAEARVIGGGPAGTLRAYQAFHPNAAIYIVEYRGRTVWMTSKQHAIWHEVQKYWRRGQRDTLARIATIVGCSKASVSRFLRRLDLWRFIDLATIRGRKGGTWIFTRYVAEPPERWTMSKRNRLRAMLAQRVKRIAYLELRDAMEQARARLHLNQRPVKIGSTGATFQAATGKQMTFGGDNM